MPLKPFYQFVFRIKEGMTKRSETHCANRIWNVMKNQAPYNRKDKVQVLIHLTAICALMLQRATEYWEEEVNDNDGYNPTL